MNELQELQQTGLKKVPTLKTGQTVRVHQRIQEGNKSRIQVFEGLIIKMNSGSGVDKTFTVRKIVSGIGVEKMFPMYSPIIEKIEVKKEGKVRRAKIYYMRDRAGKSARLKESFVSEKEVEESIEELAEQREKEEAEKKEKEAAEAPEETAAEAPAEVPAEETAEEAIETPAEEAPVEEPQAEEPQAEEPKEETPAEEPKEEPPAEEPKEKA